MRKLATIILCALAGASFAAENKIVGERLDSEPETLPFIYLKSFDDDGGLIFVDQTAPNTAEVSFDYTASGTFKVLNDQAGGMNFYFGTSGAVSASNVLQHVFVGDDSAGNEQPFGGVSFSVTDATNGSEDSELRLSVFNAGASTPLIYTGTVLSGSTDGGLDLGTAAAGFGRLYTETSAQFNFGSPSVSAFALSSSTSGDLLWVSRSAIVSGLGEYFVRRAGTNYGVGDPEIDGNNAATFNWWAADAFQAGRFDASIDTATLTVRNASTSANGNGLHAITNEGTAVVADSINGDYGIIARAPNGSAAIIIPTSTQPYGLITDSVTAGILTGTQATYGIYNQNSMFIDGSADEIQLVVQANGTQTTDLLVAESSGGTDYFSVNGGGTVNAFNDMNIGDASGDTHDFGGTSRFNLNLVRVDDGTLGSNTRASDAGDFYAEETIEADSELVPDYVTASRALYADANKVIQSSATTSTELGYVNGVTSAIQTQLDAKATAGAALTESGEYSTTPETADGDVTSVATVRYYDYFTLPSTEKYYVITGIEWTNGATVSGNVTAGVELVDADPPTVASTQLVAWSGFTAASGASTTQRTSYVASVPIRAGTLIGAFVKGNGTHTFRMNTGEAAENRQRTAEAHSADLPTGSNAAWTSSTNRVYVKVYYRGYE